VLHTDHRPRNKVATAKALFLVAAFASFLLSVSIFFLADEKAQGIFVGLWVPSILSLGTFMFAGERVR